VVHTVALRAWVAVVRQAGMVSLFLLSLLFSLSFLLRAAVGGLSSNGFPARTAFLPFFSFFSSVSGLGGGARGAILGLGCDAP
jgi:hypothetical protein